MSVGTTAAIAIGLGAVGASTAAQVYSSKRAADFNNKSLSAQERTDQSALQYQKEESARRAAADSQRWTDYLRVNEPHWNQGAQVLGSLYDLAGYGRQSAPAAPNVSAMMAAGPPQPGAQGTPVAGPPQGAPMGMPSGAPSSGASVYQATREPVRMAMQNTGGGMTLADLMNIGMMARRSAAPAAPVR